MQVIFLGAGASKCAGYPLANGLVPALQEAAATERTFVNFRDDWKIWKDYYGRARAPAKTFLASPNPEVVFSFLDLYDAAKDAVFRGRMAAIKSGDKRPRPRESRQLAEAPRARESLLRCLDWFFGFRHYDDGNPEGQSRRNYLRRLLATLTAGDVVITLNWDTTAERTLQELGQWNPTTGYGFPQPLAPGPVGSRCATDFDARQTAQLLDSPVRVLKLHGSFGWYRGPRGLYFHHDLLDPFGSQLNGERIEFTDPGHPEDGTGPPEKRILLYPSYLKQVDQPEMFCVWDEADRALREATRVRIFGYSLPPSDGAVRALLNPLRRRADRVEVSDPSCEVRQRWRQLLGPKAKIDDNRLGDRISDAT